MMILKSSKKFIEETEFDRVGVFEFSHEEGTPAYDMNTQVEDHIKKERRHELMTIQKEISLKNNKKHIGKIHKVLLEGPSQETDLLLQGRYYGQAPEIDGAVLINEGSAPIGSFL